MLLFDEPLSNLDAKLRRRMRDDIRELQQGLGLTSVYVTHDQEEALAVSDRIVVMNRGHDRAGGAAEPTSTSARRTPSSPISSAAQISIDCEVIGRDGEFARVRVGPLTLSVQSTAAKARRGETRHAALPPRC